MPGAFDDLIPTATAEPVNPFSDLIPQTREQRRGVIQQQIEQTSPTPEPSTGAESLAATGLLGLKQLGTAIDASALADIRELEAKEERLKKELAQKEAPPANIGARVLWQLQQPVGFSASDLRQQLKD